jgi:hypothetical protein
MQSPAGYHLNARKNLCSTGRTRQPGPERSAAAFGLSAALRLGGTLRQGRPAACSGQPPSDVLACLLKGSCSTLSPNDVGAESRSVKIPRLLPRGCGRDGPAGGIEADFSPHNSLVVHFKPPVPYVFVQRFQVGIRARHH